MQQFSSASTSSSVGTSSPSRGTASSSSATATSTPATSSTAVMNGNGKERERVESSTSSAGANSRDPLGEGLAHLHLGSGGANAEAISSRPLSQGASQSDESGLLDWIYQRGFINGEFNDVQLHYRHGRSPLKLHALVISQSSALLQELRYAQQTPQSPLNIYFSLDEHDEISDEALQLSISYLYSPRALGHVNASNAPAVLAAATLLQLPKLADHAFRICKETVANIVSPNEVRYWIALLDRLQSKGTGAGKAASSDYSRELNDDLMHRLTSTLPLSLHAFSSSAPQNQQAEAQTILQHIYSALPFELFKAVLESPALSNEDGAPLSDQTRFGLAKKCILERKKMQAKDSQTSEEETVVLAFGGGGAGNVQVVRKPKQNRKLWKVNG